MQAPKKYLLFFLAFGISRVLLPDIVSIAILFLASIFLVVDYGCKILIKRQRSWFNIFLLLAGCIMFGLTLHVLIAGKFLTGKKISYILSKERGAGDVKDF
jgi:energy-coupling factor transporter transmembrane protein EcfT